MKVKREIPLEEVERSPHYSDLAELARIFNHAVVEDEEGKWRWKENRLVSLLLTDTPGYRMEHPLERAFRVKLDLNTLWWDLDSGRFDVLEMMKFYMGLGYSLSGYREVFGQTMALDLSLPGALESEDEDAEDRYESVIDYVLRNYKGQVLKL